MLNDLSGKISESEDKVKSKVTSWYTTTKNYFITNKAKIIITAIVIAVLLGFALYKFLQKPQAIDTSKIGILKPIERTYIDKNNNIHSIIVGEQVSKEAMKATYDSLGKALGIKSKNIISVIKYVDKIDTVFKDSIVTTQNEDSITVTKSNKDIFVQSLYFPKNKERSYISLKLTSDTTTIIPYWKRHFLKADEINLDISHTNNLINTIAASNVTIKDRKVLFEIAPAILYDAVNKHFGAGAAIIFSPLSIKIRAK